MEEEEEEKEKEYKREEEKGRRRNKSYINRYINFQFQGAQYFTELFPKFIYILNAITTINFLQELMTDSKNFYANERI